MRESFKYGSVRGAVSNDRPYRDNRLFGFCPSLWPRRDFQTEEFCRGVGPRFVTEWCASLDTAADCGQFRLATAS